MKHSLEVPSVDNVDGQSPEKIAEILEGLSVRHAIDSLNWSKSYPYRPLAAFTIAHSQKYIYIDFFVRGNCLRAVNYTNQSPVSEDSCVEFFMEIPGTCEYWNFEFNCIGTINASHRSDRAHPTRLNEEQLASILRYPSIGKKPFEEMEGLFSWNLLVAIPFSLVGIDSDKLPMQIKGNFYKCASASVLPHYLSWSPIGTEKPNFHCPEFFGDLMLLK